MGRETLKSKRAAERLAANMEAAEIKQSKPLKLYVNVVVHLLAARLMN